MEWNQLCQILKAHGWHVDLTIQAPPLPEEAGVSTSPDAANLCIRQLTTESELADWLGHRPEEPCSRESALAIAVQAYQSQSLPPSDADERFISIGCAVSAQSPAIWMAAQTSDATSVLEFHQQHSQLAQDWPALVLAGLAKICPLPFPVAIPSDAVLAAHRTAAAEPLLRHVWQGTRPGVWRLPDGELSVDLSPFPRGLLSGSFNPLHHGHRELRAAAEERLGGPVWFEMTITNADKPPLDFLTIEDRSAQFVENPLWITNAPTFVKKAELAPQTVFVVGADTAERIVEPRFYGGEPAMQSALEQIREAGCRFLVAGRLAGDRFRTQAHIPIPAGFEDLFDPLPETHFRRDISSTQLRRPTEE